jgi:hypothetical protein
MDISSEHGGISSDKLIDYFTKQFLVDLKKMVETKDELAKRQGAIAAVEQTLALKAEAEKALADAIAQATSMTEEAKARNATSKVTEVNVKAREAAVTANEKLSAKKIADIEADLAARLKACASLEAAQAKLTDDLSARSAKLDSDSAALEARVKAFQEKVANLSA